MLEMLEQKGEMKVSQEIRQKAYDNYETTDDHGMLIPASPVISGEIRSTGLKLMGRYWQVRRIFLCVEAVRGIQDHGYWPYIKTPYPPL